MQRYAVVGGKRDDSGVGINRRYRVVGYDRGGGGVVEGAWPGGYTLLRRGGRVVECGGLENRYVGNPGVGGSNPPLSAKGTSSLTFACPWERGASSSGSV